MRLSEPTEAISITPVKPKSHEEIEPSTVEAFDNHIFFYAPVETDTCLTLIRSVREVDARLHAEHFSRELQSSSMTPIWLHINSGGGDLMSALAVVDQFEHVQSPLYGIAEGLCASAATLLLLACSKRYMLPNSFMLIHQFSTWHYGTHEQFKDNMRVQHMLMNTIVDFYKNRSELNKKQLKKLLKHDYWMSAPEALKKGFIDEIWNGKQSNKRANR